MRHARADREKSGRDRDADLAGEGSRAMIDQVISVSL
jgi:hypothetical protein